MFLFSSWHDAFGPALKSFAADAHDCIMVAILTDRPNTSLWRDVSRLMVSSPRYRRSFADTEPKKEIRPITETQRETPVRPEPTKSATVLATVKGKSLRDGLRPPLTFAARSSQ